VTALPNLSANVTVAALHQRPASRPTRHRGQIEHVVYRYNGECSPSITFHSMPHACTGGADTLDEARNCYRSNMTALLGISRRELPSVVEHVECVFAGIWVRDRVGAVHRDTVNDRMFVQTLLSAGPRQDDLRAYLERATNAGAKLVVVLVDPDDTLGVVLNQMRAEDALLVVHSDPQDVLGWVAIYGPDACGADDAVNVDDYQALRTAPIVSLTRAYGVADRRAIRLRRVIAH
jgi:hypothetical protein